MTASAAQGDAGPDISRGVVISALGVMQILAWGSSYYLPAVLARPIAEETGWPLPWIVGGLSLGLIVAGLVLPVVGRTIERRGGRPVLAASAGLLAAGLAGVALSSNLAMYLGAWLVLGLGMGAGLYDAAFATLGRLYGLEARRAITALTLFGGFASTISWPLSAVMVEALGWRGACLVYAALHLLLVLPVCLFLLPRERIRTPAPSGRVVPGRPASGRSATLVLLATILALAAALSSVLSVHLLTILQAREVALAGAVALGALVGPSQVGARLVEMVFGRRYHPIWTMTAAACLMAAGIGLLLAGSPLMAAGLVFYGAGIGIKSIARGTLPLSLFGESGYAALIGRLALPCLLAEALSPALAAMLLERSGASDLLTVLSLVAAVNVGLTLLLFARTR